MKLVTWNVNSIRARHDRTLAFLERESPDILCLQELKCTDDNFPHNEVQALGYHAATHGQPTYNGVAILAKQPITDIHKGIDNPELDQHARLIAATIDNIRIISAYVPNGSSLDSDKFTFKKAWMDAMRAYLDTHCDPSQPLALVGDFNVAPAEIDIAKPDKWQDSVLTHDEVRTRLANWQQWGLSDTPRLLNPDDPMLSWWDYRQLAFPKGNGLRIDHIFTTHALHQRATAARVDRDERKGKGASDHAPVIAEFSL